MMLCDICMLKMLIVNFFFFVDNWKYFCWRIALGTEDLFTYVNSEECWLKWKHIYIACIGVLRTHVIKECMLEENDWLYDKTSLYANFFFLSFLLNRWTFTLVTIYFGVTLLMSNSSSDIIIIKLHFLLSFWG